MYRIDDLSDRASPNASNYGGDYHHGDDQFALNVVASISGRIADLHMTDNEQLCTAALALSASSSQLLPDAHKPSKKVERRATDFFQKSLTPEQARNHSLRFGTKDHGPPHRTSSSWGFLNLNMDSRYIARVIILYSYSFVFYE